jgi:putative peptide zinc metalloprotease protein
MSVASAAAAPPLGVVEGVSSDAELAKIVVAPLRVDLVMQRQLFRGTEYYVIKDPLALTYFRLQYEEGFLITLLDGKRNMGEIHRRFCERFPNQELSLNDVGLFVGQMSGAGLLNVNARQFVKVARAQETVRTSWLLMWGKLIAGLLFMRFPLFDPSPWLGRLTHAIRFIWTRWFIGLCLAFITWSAFWLIVHRDAFTQNTITFFTPENLFLIWVTIIIVKTIHEFGHATTCRFFGGEVHEMGVCLICFAPAGYVDASDAWMMRNKAHKLYTTMAGVFVEFVVAGIAAHLWLYLPNGLAKNLAFNAMIVASVNTVFFNANPLMKFDGYYILSDVMEIPNLRGKAMTYCSYHIQRLLLGYRNLVQEHALGDEVHNRAFVVYAVLAFAYMMTVIYSLTQVFARFLGPYGLHDFGLAIGIFVEGSFLMFPILKVLSDAFAASKTARIAREEPVARRVARWLIPIVVGALIFFRLPSHYRVDQQAVVVAVNSERAGVEFGGVVEKIHVQTGQWIERDQPLLTLRNDDIAVDAEVSQLSYEAAKVGLSVAQAEGSLHSSSQAPRAALAVESAATTNDRGRKAAEKLVVRAPASGYVVTPDIDRLQGQYLGPGFNGLRVADHRAFKLLIPLTEAQTELIEIGSQVRGRVLASGQRIEGAVAVLPRQKAGWQDYHPAMLSTFGGPAPFEYGATSDRTQPAFGLFLAEADVAKPPPGLIEELRVKVTIEGRKATFGERTWRWIVSLWRSRTSM